MSDMGGSRGQAGAGQRAWEWGGEAPRGVWGTLCVAVHCCFQEDFASHLRSRNRQAAHEPGLFLRLDTMSHAAQSVSLFALLL